MSPTDITAVQKVAPGTRIVRDGSDLPAGTTAQPQGRNARDTAVKVEAGVSADLAQPPVDQSRVAEIRAALAQGAYPLVPTKIADAMIAAPMLLSAAK